MLCKNNDFEHAHLKRFLVPFFRQKKVHARFEISEKMSIFRVGGALNSQPLNQVNISQWRYLNQRFRTLLRGCRLPKQRFGLHRKTTIYLFTNLFNCDIISSLHKLNKQFPMYFIFRIIYSFLSTIKFCICQKCRFHLKLYCIHRIFVLRFV